MTDKTESLLQTMQAGPVIPVVKIERIDDALPLTEALLAGGVKTIEITLRSDAALPAAQKIIEAQLPIAVGIGTIASPEQLDQAEQIGASFGVSPGLTPRLLKAAPQSALPLLPGVATASELMTALDAGFELCKFFPAAAAGGIDMLKSFAGPFAQARFCPTGGISLASADDYLSLPNVICVGGSWLTPSGLIASGNWAEITKRAGGAAAITTQD